MIIEGDINSDIDHIGEIDIMIGCPTEKTLGQTTSEVATEIFTKEGDKEVNQDHQPKKEILVGKILGQDQYHQREMMMDIINANSLDTMQKITQKKKRRLNPCLLKKSLSNIDREIKMSIQMKKTLIVFKHYLVRKLTIP